VTQDDIDNGRLVILLGFAPHRPAEFLFIRIKQQRRSLGLVVPVAGGPQD
jgi:phage tail sheath protein FI